MIEIRWVLALVLAIAGADIARSGPFDLPKPDVFVRAEDQQRARLHDTPCTEADIGHGCYRYDGRLLRESPCAYHIDGNAIAFTPTDRCFKMDPPKRYRGTWIDAFEGQSFIPEGVTIPEWPKSRPGSPGWREQAERARAATIWLDVSRVKLDHDSARDGRKVAIEFIGRKTMFTGAYGHMGMSGNEIIVDRVISMKELR